MARHLFGSAEGVLVRSQVQQGTPTVAQIIDNHLRHDFCLAVRAICFETRRFGDWDHRGCSVDSSRRRIDDASAVEVGHGLQQRHRSSNVVRVVC